MMEQVLNFLIQPAAAQSPLSGASGAQGGGFSFVIMFVIFFAFIYFAIWRPQNKRAREQQAMLNALAKGDEVITAGGFLGRINTLSDQYVHLALTDAVEVVMQKSAISSVLPKGTMKAIE